MTFAIKLYRYLLQVEMSAIRNAVKKLCVQQKDSIDSQKEAVVSHKELRDAFYEFSTSQLANEYDEENEDDLYQAEETGMFFRSCHI